MTQTHALRAAPSFPMQRMVTATAPGKVILFGEHAINRGQPALAASAGLYARCTCSVFHTWNRKENPAGAHDRERTAFHFHSGDHSHVARREEILSLGEEIDSWRASENYEAIRALKARDFFAPQKYILASAFGQNLPNYLDLQWESEVPPASGLGSGGSAFTAMVAAVSHCLWSIRPVQARAAKASLEQRADWAHRGDIIAHGGIASALDTQTSLLGGVIRYSGQGLATSVGCADGLNLVIAHSGVGAPTSEVNTRVRVWLAERPRSRLQYFHAIGALTRAAETALARGDWDELGRLMTLNQLVLEKIDLTCPEVDHLIDAALAAGAHGAKISGSGGGGIIIALVSAEKKSAVAEALAQAGGNVLLPEIGVPGVRTELDSNPILDQ